MEHNEVRGSDGAIFNRHDADGGVFSSEDENSS